MARLPRVKSSLKIYHIMIRGVNKQDIFLDNQDRKVFMKCILKSKEKFEYSIYSYVLMKNHVHLEIMDNDVMSKIIHYIASSYAMYFNNKYNRVGHLFQDRYKSKPVENEKYLLTLMRYIHQNPEKAGISLTQNYQWSSYKDYIEGWKDIVEIDYILDIISSDRKKALLEFEKINNQTVKLDSKEILEFEIKTKLSDDELKQVITEIIGKNILKNFCKFNKIEKEKIIKNLESIKGTSAAQIARILKTEERNIERIYKIK